MIYRRRRKPGGLGQANRIVQTDRAGVGERGSERRVRGGGHDDIRSGLVYKNPISRAHRSLAILEWVPGKAKPRLKIPVVLMVDLLALLPDADKRGRLRVEDNEAAIALVGCHVPFVT